jgi:hypothetical protein
VRYKCSDWNIKAILPEHSANPAILENHLETMVNGRYVAGLNAVGQVSEYRRENYGTKGKRRNLALETVNRRQLGLISEGQKLRLDYEAVVNQYRRQMNL